MNMSDQQGDFPIVFEFLQMLVMYFYLQYIKTYVKYM